jgi:hypothetical protein
VGGHCSYGFDRNFSWSPDIQKISESGDATDTRGDAQDVHMDEDSASYKDGDGYAAAESEDEQVFQTIPHSPMINQTRSKSPSQRLAPTVPDAILSSASEDKLPRLQPRKHIHASPVSPSAGGYTKYFLRNSNQFPSVASKKCTASQGSAGDHGGK